MVINDPKNTVYTVGKFGEFTWALFEHLAEKNWRI